MGEEGDMDPGSVIPDLNRDRGDGLLKQPGSIAGCRAAEGTWSKIGRTM